MHARYTFSLVENVRESVPLSATLQRHEDRVIGVPEPGDGILRTSFGIRASGKYLMNRVQATTMTGLGTIGVLGKGAADRLAGASQTRRPEDALRIDVDNCAEFVVGYQRSSENAIG